MPTARPFSVVKIGGALAQKPQALADLWRGVADLSRSHAVVVVHGAGPQMTAHARLLGHEPTIVAGRRVTGDIDLQIATHVMAGEVNAAVTASAVGAGVAAVGMAALSGKTVVATRRPPVEMDGETVDFGHVGDLESVDVNLLKLLAGSYVPVVSSLCANAQGQLLNVNADTVAGELARALQADRLLLVTEAGGIRAKADDPASRVPILNGAAFRAGVAAGWITDGMRVKGDVGFAALQSGVASVTICTPGDLGRFDAGTRLSA